MNPNYTVHILSKNTDSNSPVVNIRAHMPEAFTMDTSSEYVAPFTQGLTGNALVDTVLKVGLGLRLVNQTLTAQIWQGSAETVLGLELEFHAEHDPVTEVQQPILQLMKMTVPSTIGEDGLLQSPGPKISPEAVRDLVASYSSKVDMGFLSDGLSGITDMFSGSKQASLVDPTMTCTNGNSQAMQVQRPEQNSQYGAHSIFKRSIKDQISIQIGRFAFFDSVVITNVQKTYESRLDAFTGLPHYAKVSIQFKPLFMIVQKDLDNIFNGAQASTGPQNMGPGSISSNIDLSAEVATAFPMGAEPGSPLTLTNQGPNPGGAQTFALGQQPGNPLTVS